MILHQIAAHAARRVESAMKRAGLDEMREAAGALPKGGFRFENALKGNGLSLICEVKRASPSRGLIAPEFPYREIARGYESAGAECVSCLTEPKWFLGSDDIFREIRSDIGIPMLRKDFTVHEYQIYEAKCMGADAVLLICALLSSERIARYLGICDGLGMSALVEAHDAAEVRAAISAGARVIGVNNRNLKDFSVDFSNAARLRDLVPPDTLYVAESGVRTPKDAAALQKAGADAVLIGEALMRERDRGTALLAYRAAVREAGL